MLYVRSVENIAEKQRPIVNACTKPGVTRNLTGYALYRCESRSLVEASQSGNIEDRELV